MFFLTTSFPRSSHTRSPVARRKRPWERGCRFVNPFKQCLPKKSDLESVFEKFCLRWPFHRIHVEGRLIRRKNILFKKNKNGVMWTGHEFLYDCLWNQFYIFFHWHGSNACSYAVFGTSLAHSRGNYQRGIRDSHKGSAIEFQTLSLNWVLKTWYPCMRCYQVIELLSLFRFHPVSNKPTKRTKKHAKMIFKFCDESCSLHVNKNQFSDYHGGWSVYISYLSCTILLMV